MMAAAQPWPGFKYVQVPGLANRKIARWLRTQRKNMLRFFYAQGLLELAGRMEMIRKSRQGMMAKNRMFQKVLDDYAKLASGPQSLGTAGATTPAVPETNNLQDAGDAAVGVPDPVADPAAGTVRGDGPGPDAAAGVRELEVRDESADGVVVEE